MKKSLIFMLLFISLLYLVGCGKNTDIKDNTSITETTPVSIEVSQESKTNSETTVNTGDTTIKNNAEEEKGYAATKFRTYADEDMKRLGVDKKLAIICSFRIAALPESITSKFNELLVNKYGCDFVVEFIGFNVASGAEYEYGETINDIRMMEQQADIIVSGSDKTATYTALVNNGLLVELTDMLTNTEEGKMIYDALPTGNWNCVERDGRIYGIAPLRRNYSTRIFVCNNKLAEECGVEVKEGFSFYDIENMLAPVSEKLIEQGILGGYYYRNILVEMFGYYELTDFEANGHGIYAKSNGNGEWIAVNPLLDDEFVKLCRTIRKYKEKGWLASDHTPDYLAESKKIDSGKFIFYIDNLYGNNQILDNKVYTEETGLIEVVVGKTDGGYLSLNEANITGIASWSQYKEEALKLLRIMQTEEDICNLLTYGIEGEHYEYVNREVVLRTNNIFEDAMGNHAVMLNQLLTYSVYLEPDNKAEYYTEIMSNAKESPFMRYGITYDEYRTVAEGYSELIEIRDKYILGLLDGSFEDVDEAIAEAIKLQEETGINELIDKVNKLFER